MHKKCIIAGSDGKCIDFKVSSTEKDCEIELALYGEVQFEVYGPACSLRTILPSNLIEKIVQSHKAKQFPYQKED